MNRPWLLVALMSVLAGACAGSTRAQTFALANASPVKPRSGRAISDAMHCVAEVVASKRRRIAVLPFQERGVGPTQYGAYVADKLLVELTRTGQVELVERARLEEVFAEQSLGVIGELSDATAASIGNLTGAEAVIAGTLTPLGGTWEVVVRVLGSEDAIVLAATEATWSSSSVPETLVGVKYERETRPRAEPAGPGREH